MANILIVDDEKEIVDLVALYLQNSGHHPIPFYDPVPALESDLGAVDLAILDVMMPGINGFQFCSELRKQELSFPIIMLTAKDTDNDKINGLMLGADDYVVKPFNPLELVARVTAQLRRAKSYSTTAPAEAVIDINGLTVNEQAHTCRLYGADIDLTPTEFSILALLAKNLGKVISSEEIFESVWGEKFMDSNNTVMVHIQKLRKKLGDVDKKKKFIQTVWGVGYKIEG